eukprot:2865861-Prymnesium_polylepis.1
MVTGCGLTRTVRQALKSVHFGRMASSSGQCNTSVQWTSARVDCPISCGCGFILSGPIVAWTHLFRGQPRCWEVLWDCLQPHGHWPLRFLDALPHRLDQSFEAVVPM